MSTLPPWQVDAWDLEKDLVKIRQQWDPVRRILEDAPLCEVAAPSISGWSCGEQARHIVLTTRVIASAVGRHFRKPDSNTEGEWTRAARGVLEDGVITRGAVQAPAALDPATSSREEVLRQLPADMAAWETLSERADEMPALRARSPHSALGYLDTVDWVRMCAVHTAHHLAIVRDIVAAADPAADVSFLSEPS